MLNCPFLEVSMPKHKRKHRGKELSTTATVTEVMAEVSAEQGEPVVTNIPESLAAIRTQALQTDAGVRTERLQIQEETARTIADLEAWRDEIDRTLAFLKAR
jgi:uncharacterized protein YicC (UPF0701 family)